MSATVTPLRPAVPIEPAASESTPPAPLGTAHYVESVVRLHEEAIAHREVESFVDALAMVLAWIIHDFGSSSITGDVLVKLGRHLETFHAKAQAEAELAAKKAEGFQPN